MPESGIIITATYCRLQVGFSGVIMLMESIINLLGGTLLTVMILCYWCYVLSLLKNKGRTSIAVFLLRQLWIVNYYVKSLSNNLTNDNIVFPEKLYIKKSSFFFGISIHILS